MKTIVQILSVLLIFIAPTKAQFRTDSSWASVLAEAKLQHKPIFLDVYTTWCKPCKQLEREVFSTSSVSQKLNQSFISYRLDAEKGEGVEIASSYQVQSYPAMFFLDTKGNQIHKIEGFLPAESFLRETDFALSLLADEKQIGSYEEEFKKGNRNPDFLYKFLRKKALYREDTGQILEEYIKQLPFDSLHTPQTWQLMMTHASLLKGKVFELLMSRRNDDKVFQKLTRMRAGGFSLAVRTQNEQILEEALSLTQRIARSDVEAQEIMLSQQMLFYLATKNKTRLPAVAEPYLRRFVMNKSVAEITKQGQQQRQEEGKWSNHYASQLARVSQFYIENFNEKSILEQALTWIQRSVLLAEKSSNLDTYAHILHKLGNTYEARITQEKAIEIAKNAKEDNAYINYLKEELAKM